MADMLTVLPRINALAAKAKSPEGLTDDEKMERDELRKIYLQAFRENFKTQLDNTYIVSPDGTKKKLTNKKEF